MNALNPSVCSRMGNREWQEDVEGVKTVLLPKKVLRDEPEPDGTGVRRLEKQEWGCSSQENEQGKDSKGSTRLGFTSLHSSAPSCPVLVPFIPVLESCSAPGAGVCPHIPL